MGTCSPWAWLRLCGRDEGNHPTYADCLPFGGDDHDLLVDFDAILVPENTRKHDLRPIADGVHLQGHGTMTAWPQQGGADEGEGGLRASPHLGDDANTESYWLPWAPKATLHMVTGHFAHDFRQTRWGGPEVAPPCLSVGLKEVFILSRKPALVFCSCSLFVTIKGKIWTEPGDQGDWLGALGSNRLPV